MADFGAWILLFEFLIFLASVPIAVVIVKKLNEGARTSDTLVIHRDGGKCGGKVIGNLISKRPQDGRLLIEYMSRDSKKNKIIKVAANPNNIISYPKGLWSGEKDIIEILPISAIDYINNLLTRIEVAGAENSIIVAQRAGKDRQKMHLKDIGEGEVSNVNLGLIKDFTQQALKTISKEEKVPKPGSYQRPETFGA